MTPAPEPAGPRSMERLSLGGLRPGTPDVWNVLYPEYRFQIRSPVDTWPKELVALIPGFAAAWAPDGWSLATLCNHQGLQTFVWDLSGTRPRVRVRSKSRRHLTSYTFSPDDRRLACGSRLNSFLLVMDLTTEDAEATMFDTSINAAIHALAFSSEGRRLAVWANHLDRGSRLQLWDMTAEPRQLLLTADVSEFRGNEAMRIAFARDGKTMILTTARMARLADITDGQVSVHQPPKEVKGEVLCWSQDLTKLAAAREDRTVVIYQREGDGWKEGKSLVGHQKDGAFHSGFSPDGHWLLTNERHGKLYGLRTLIWDADGHLRCDWPLPSEFFEFAPDNRHLLVRHDLEGPCYIYRLPH